jgi:hypothetical protein
VSEAVVDVAVVSASVHVTVTISTTSGTQASSFESTLATSLGTVASATAVLGVPVTSTPTISVDTGATGADSGEDESSVPIGAIAGGAGGGAVVVILVALAVVICKKRMAGRKAKNQTHPAP